MDSDAVQLLTKALSIGLMWSRVAHALSDCEHLDTQSVCCHRAIIVSRINLHVFMCVVRLRRQILDDLSNECEDFIASQEIWAATPQSSALYECMNISSQVSLHVKQEAPQMTGTGGLRRPESEVEHFG